MISLIRCVYNALFPVVVLLMLPSFIVRMFQRGKYRHKFGQRFAIYSEGVLEKIENSGRIWIHAVSVGEVNIALKLIHAMRESDPSFEFVLSTTTSTGFKLAATSKTPWLEPIYNPLDFYPIARRAVRLIRPRALILIEAEVWPNIVCEVCRSGARVAMVNARLSPRSEKRYRAARWITAPIFNQLHTLCLQEPSDLPRWISLGVDASKLQVTGSIKFDDSASAARPIRDFRPALSALGVDPSAPVLLGGSTFDGEELILAQAFMELRKTHKNLFLILVPRHQERGDAVMRQIESLGLRVARRTQSIENPDVLLVDTTGELVSWYRCATVVFIGKSLTAKGGQNPAEPVAAGISVVFGPHMQNFSTLVHAFLRDRAAIQIEDAATLQVALDRLLSSPDLRKSMVQRALAVLAIHSGATARTLGVLKKSILFLEEVPRNNDKSRP